MRKSPFILAIDTSLGPCSVALIAGDAIAAVREESAHGMQSKRLVPMIEETLREAGATYGALDAVACTIGPGGFTGIRTGLATARAIALAAQKPLIGLTTLETIAWSSGLTGDVLAVVDAYRGQYFAQRFTLGETLIPRSDPLLVEETTLKALGHGAKTAHPPLHARDVALLAAGKWDRGERNFPDAPLYIREPDAKPPASQSLKCGGEVV